MKFYKAIGIALIAAAQPALAQPVDLPIPAATTTQYPPGISVKQTANGPVYVDAKGRTLYGMDMRMVLRWSPNAALYCKDRCTEWEPILAAPDAKPNIVFPRGFGSPPPAPGARPAAPAPDNGAPRVPGQLPVPQGFFSQQNAPDWTVIEGPGGPQWVYKGWHMVYVRKGERPGSTAFDGAENRTWNTLKFVPPKPVITAPSSVAVLFSNGAYQLTDDHGRALFTGKCTASCSDWKPLAAPMAGRGFGEWTISLTGDSPQWAWRGQPVFVSYAADPLQIPSNGKVLRP